MRGFLSIFLSITIALFVGCETEPEAAYFDREGPPKQSDTLVEVLAAMVDGIQAMPLTGDRDVDNVEEMILHHKATIDMNSILIHEGEDEELKKFAKRLSNTQLKEIAEMQAFLDSHPEVAGRGKRGRPNVLMGLAEFEPTDDLDQAYAELMEMHLHDAITMSEETSERALHDEMKELAKRITQSTRDALEELGSIRE